MTFAERWNARRLEWVAVYERLGHPPKQHSDSDPQQDRASKWQNCVRQAYKGQGTCRLSTQQKEIMNNTTGWLWEKSDTFENGYMNWIAQYERLLHVPKHDSNKIDINQKRASKWRLSILNANNGIGNLKITPEQKDRLNNTQGWLWTKPNAFENGYTQWVEQHTRLGRLPKANRKSNADPEQNIAAAWQTYMRSVFKIKNTSSITPEQKDILNSTPGWLWKVPNHFDCGYAHWVLQYNRLKHTPILIANKNQDPEQYFAAKWQSYIRQKNKGKGKQLTLEQKRCLNNTQGWMWEAPNAFNRNYSHWIAQHERLGHPPKRVKEETDPEQFRAATWQRCMRQAYFKRKRCGKLAIEQKQLLNSTPGWLWIGK